MSSKNRKQARLAAHTLLAVGRAPRPSKVLTAKPTVRRKPKPSTKMHLYLVGAVDRDEIPTDGVRGVMVVARDAYDARTIAQQEGGDELPLCSEEYWLHGINSFCRKVGWMKETKKPQEPYALMVERVGA